MSSNSEMIAATNEPKAAVIAFGVEQALLSPKGEADQRETILIRDLAATLMEIDCGKYVAVATSEGVVLGWIDWDRRIVDHDVEQ